ncbi:MAG: phenylalanine--tRNA ligase subunit beta [Alphaproteobacteria bacterium]|nr:phenylalanine--tRNA ligase subunit beta [Alphaproteobacteria bacterium]
MKWTFDWLRDYLKTDLSAQEIADILTRTGLEVEDLIAPLPPIAAKIVECKPHENSDHLHVLLVDDGSKDLRQVVCGAPNARVGLVSALARPGCVIEGHEIQSGKLRGVLSDGMMCSGRELGINDDHSGIIELPENTKIGSVVVDCPVIFDAGITPNRPDYLAVRGVARDLSAAGAGEFIEPKCDKFVVSGNAHGVQIKTDKCRAYKLAEIHDIHMTKSNDKIASRLHAIGINPKNAPIDATNYICYDMAQPMHCFDADEIVGDIIVRMAKDGEEFTDLFGNTHKLATTDIVITDADGILALAGVVGGARGCTSDKTKNIILESAYFDPVCVRKTSKRLGISTDASYRYERGIDPTITGPALMNTVKIITDACGGKIIGFASAGDDSPINPVIEYSTDTFVKKTGIEMSEDEMRNILTRLGYTGKMDGKVWKITAPNSRVDVQIPETVVADLIRIYGYEKVGLNYVPEKTIPAEHNDLKIPLKEKLANRGLNESITFGFGNSRVEKLLTNKPIIKIANPIVVDLDTARNNLIGNLLIAVANNEKRGYPDLNLFEMGPVFDGDMPGEQHTSICVVRTGATSPRHWQKRNRDVDIYDVKADIVSLLCGQNFTVSTENPPLWAHPYRYGRIMQGNKILGEFGELHPSVAKQLKIKTNVVIGLVEDINNLPSASVKRRPVKLSEFQPISRDFAFIVPSDFPAEKLTAAARTASSLVSDIVVFDSFEMANGQKSVAFTVTLVPTEKMSEDDLTKLHSDIIAAVEKKCPAHVRDK